MFQCYIVNFPLGEYLLYSKVYGGKAYYIANIPRENIRGMIGYGCIYYAISINNTGMSKVNLM
jgi:hypothetical protein